MNLPRHVTRVRLEVGVGAILLVWYLADLSLHYESAEILLARFGIGTLGAKLVMATPVVLYALFACYRLSCEAHQSSTAPNNRWRGP
jgi:hypothetical protein